MQVDQQLDCFMCRLRLVQQYGSKQLQCIRTWVSSCYILHLHFTCKYYICQDPWIFLYIVCVNIVFREGFGFSEKEMEGLIREGRSLAETPTWSVATVTTVMVFLCLLVQRSLYKFGRVSNFHFFFSGSI